MAPQHYLETKLLKGDLAAKKNAPQPMEAKKHMERTAGFGERRDAVNLIKNNKDQRYQMKKE